MLRRFGSDAALLLIDVQQGVNVLELRRAGVSRLHGEFCTALDVPDVGKLPGGDRPDLERVWGNE